MPGCPAVAVKVFGAGDSDDPDVSTPRAAPEDSRSPGGTGSLLDRLSTACPKREAAFFHVIVLSSPAQALGLISH
jgi:hypothetical protein